MMRLLLWLVLAALAQPALAGMDQPTINGGTDGTPIGNDGDKLKVSSYQTTTPWVTSAAQSGVWSLRLQDGSGNLIGSTSGSLNVNVTNSFAAGTADRTAFTYGTSIANAIAGVYNDTGTTLTSGQMGAARLTAERGLHLNLRNNGGTEIGTNANPVQVQLGDGTNRVDVDNGAQDGESTGQWGLYTNSRNYIFGGSGWDRLRSPNQGNNLTGPNLAAAAVGDYGQYNATPITITDTRYAVKQMDVAGDTKVNLRKSDGTETGIPAAPLSQTPYLQYNATLPDVTSGLTGPQQGNRKGVALATLYDAELNRQAVVDEFGNLRTSEPTRLIGGNFPGSSLNTMIWTSTLATGGTLTVGNNLAQLTTTTTNGSSSTVISTDVAPAIAGTVNLFRAGVRLSDTGVANNERRWGAWASTNGIYYKLAGTAFSVCKLQTSVETCIASGSFNGLQPTIDTNFHNYEIYYATSGAYFMQDGKLLHNYSMTTTALADTTSFPLQFQNKNVGASTAASLYIRQSAIMRLGRPNGRPRASAFSGGTASTVLKSEPGTVHNIIINRNGGVGNTTIVLYDNTAASGTVIFQATIPGTVLDAIPLDIDFNTGLTLSITNGILATQEITVTWE